MLQRGGVASSSGRLVRLETKGRELAVPRIGRIEAAEVQRIEAQTRADGLRIGAEAETESRRLSAESAAREEQIRTEAEVAALLRRQEAAAAYTKHPALLRLAELEALRDLSKLASARIYIGFDKHRADADSE